MMHLFLNALAASVSSGLTYVRNVVPHLSRLPGVHTTVAVNADLQVELGTLPQISFATLGHSQGAGRRFFQEQVHLPQVLRESGADVLISAGNVALRNSPVPQILLSGNSLYSSADFFRDLRKRWAYGIWLDTRLKALLARRSVQWADCTVAPSRAYADELRRWAGGEVVGIYHGFDPAVLFGDQRPLPADLQAKLDASEGTLRLLFVSHYNYYRNFETLFRALPLLRGRLQGRKVRLFLTCKLRRGENPGNYRTGAAAALVRGLGAADEIVELGAVPYRQLHHLYRACDLYVTAAYAESFAHPLVEAMASGLPIVASDLAVHREIAASGAIFFPTFSPERLAEQIHTVATDKAFSQQLSARGLARARDFSWKLHVEQLVTLAGRLCGRAQAAA